MPLVEEADRLAHEAHAGQTRRHGAPYISHPRAVLRILDDMAFACALAVDDGVRATALLHDVLEDCEAFTPAILSQRFGPVVAGAVVALTKTGKGDAFTAAYYAELQQAVPSTKLVKICDRLHNLSELHKQPDPQKVVRYVDETLLHVRPLALSLHAGLVAAIDNAIDNARANARAALWPGVDVVVVGRAAAAPLAPVRSGDAVVVSAGWQGQYAGVLTLHLDQRQAGAPLALRDEASAEARKRLLDVRVLELDRLLAALPEGAPKTFQQDRRDKFAAERATLAAVDDVVAPTVPTLVVQALPLKRGMAEEAEALRALTSYERSIPLLVGQCEKGVTCPEPTEGSAHFVGAATCKACHAEAFATWQLALVDVTATNKDGSKSTHKSGHSVAWPTLVSAGRDKDRSCIGCHSAGFDVAGGACTTTLLLSKELTGVQCESCHGAGSLHVQGGGDASKIRRLVDESVCRGCHVPPHIESVSSFVYEERVLKILGAGHRRRPLQELP